VCRLNTIVDMNKNAAADCREQRLCIIDKSF
jgi:hypothetical protein